MDKTLEELYAAVWTRRRRPPHLPMFHDVVYNGINPYESATHLCNMGAPEGYVFLEMRRKMSRAVLTYLWVGGDV